MIFELLLFLFIIVLFSLLEIQKTEKFRAKVCLDNKLVSNEYRDRVYKALSIFEKRVDELEYLISKHKRKLNKHDKMYVWYKMTTDKKSKIAEENSRRALAGLQKNVMKDMKSSKEKFKKENENKFALKANEPVSLGPPPKTKEGKLVRGLMTKNMKDTGSSNDEQQELAGAMKQAGPPKGFA
jgi:hypothetical protein